MLSFPSIPDIGNWRFEYKYFLSQQQASQIRNAIIPFTIKDPYTKNANSGKYLVRSLYFDSYNYQSYHEKIDGNCDRIKIRIRTYAIDPNQQSTMRAELKIRKGATTEKYGTLIHYKDYESFIRHHHWINLTDPVLIEFERYFYLKGLHPLLVVQYDREGFFSRGEEDVRITFDHHVQSTPAKTLFPKFPHFREHHRQTIVLEIKCVKNQPAWLHKLIQSHGLRIVPCSKFAKGIEVSRPDIVNPSWSN